MARQLDRSGHRGAAAYVRRNPVLQYVGETENFSRRDREHSSGTLFMDKIYNAVLSVGFAFCLCCFVVNLHFRLIPFRSSLEPVVVVLANEEDFGFRNLLEALYASALGLLMFIHPTRGPTMFPCCCLTSLAAFGFLYRMPHFSPRRGPQCLQLWWPPAGGQIRH